MLQDHLLKKFYTNNFKKETSLYLFILCFLILLRFVFTFFNLDTEGDVITSLIIGRDINEGHLPYIQSWDIRGPLSFFIYALALKFKSYFIPLKLLAIFFIWISSIIIFAISKKIFRFSYLISAFAAVSFALLCSSNVNTFAAHQEIFQTTFLCGFLYFLLDNKKINIHNFFYSGFLISLAVLIKQNAATLSILGFFFIIIHKDENFVKKVLLYIAGGITPLIFLIILYSFEQNGVQIFFNSTVGTVLGYTDQKPIINGLYDFFFRINTKEWFLYFCIPFIFFFHLKEKSKKVIFLYIGIILQILNVLIVRKYSDHHIVPLLPFVIILVANLLSNFNFKKKINYYIIIIFFIGPLISNVSNQINLLYNHNNKSLVLCEVLKKDLGDDQKIFSFDQYLYLCLNKKILTSIVHPSNLFKNQILQNYYNDPNLNKEIFLLRILRKDPDVVIIPQHFYNKLPLEFITQLDLSWQQITIDSEPYSNLNKNVKEYVLTTKVYRRK